MLASRCDHDVLGRSRGRQDEPERDDQGLPGRRRLDWELDLDGRRQPQQLPGEDKPRGQMNWCSAVALALGVASCGAPSSGAPETLAEFRQRTAALLAASGSFQDAARYLRAMDFIGESATVGRCKTF